MDKVELQERMTAFAVRIVKMVEEELDETCHRLDIIMRSELMPTNRLQPLHQECKELLSIVVKSIVTTKKRFNVTALQKLLNSPIVHKL